jgi:hypothetical protein
VAGCDVGEGSRRWEEELTSGAALLAGERERGGGAQPLRDRWARRGCWAGGESWAARAEREE